MIDVATIKAAAAKRELELLKCVGKIPADVLDGRHHPCPKCGGTDRFRMVDGDAGAVRCNKCFAQKNGDFLSAIKWSLDCSFPDVLGFCAEHLGIPMNGKSNASGYQSDLIGTICNRKRMPVASFKAYGAQPAERNGTPVARVPLYDQKGERRWSFDLGLSGKLEKGMIGKGDSHGLFLPGRVPQPDESWLMVEGVKDAAAAHARGYDAAGVCSCRLGPELARLFRDVDVILVPDRDEVSVRGFTRAGKVLTGVASSVRIATLPLPMNEGGDVRDCLALNKGEELLRQALEDAVDLDVSTVDMAEPISNGETPPDPQSKRDPLVARALSKVAAEIRHRADGAPYVANGALFVQVGDEIHWLEKTESVFAWLASLGGTRWHTGAAFSTKAELRAFLGFTSKCYEAIEQYPHEPRIADHYYLCEEVEPGDGSHLQQLLDMFSPETSIDRDLLQAFAMTIAWGGPGGARPGFIFTADGRGFGKTTTVEKIASIFGGCVSFGISDKGNQIKERLLSTGGLARRVALLDNVKTHKLGSGDLEALLTASDISGKRMYVGDATRPNTITWAITLNGVSLSKDMAERCVIVRLKRPVFSGDWEANITAFIEENRLAIIGDLVAALRSDRFTLNEYSRWGLWERNVLERLPEPNEAQRVIQERSDAVDSDQEEAALILDGFRSRLADLNYRIDEEPVFIPTAIAAQWYGEITGVRLNTVAVGRSIGQLIDEKQLRSLQKSRTESCRGFTWVPAGKEDSSVAYDLQNRIERCAEQK